MELEFLSTYIIIAACCIVSIKGFQDRSFTEDYLFQPYRVKIYRENYRFVTHPFLHADQFHLIFNCFTMYYFGRSLEGFFNFWYGPGIGELVFWIFVILSMFASSLISYFRHRENEGYRSLGLSGVTSAVLFASILLAPTMSINIMFIPIDIPAYIFGPIYIAFEIYSDRNRKTNIAHDAHIGGALFGIVFILITNIELVQQGIKSIFE